MENQQQQLNEAVALLIGNLTIENQALKLQLQAARALIEPPATEGHAAVLTKVGNER